MCSRNITKFLVFCFLSLSCAVQAKTLVIQSSDQHNNYTRFPNFLASIEVVSRKFKQKYPKSGKPILIINGDFTSHPRYWPKESKNYFQILDDENNIIDSENIAFEDKGDIAYKILAKLAKKYTVIYTFGNHDSFDWEDPKVFLRQMEILSRAGVHILAANVALHKEYKGLITPYVDLELSPGNVTRFVGFSLPYDKKKVERRISKNAPFAVKELLDTKGKLKEIIRYTNADKAIQSLVLIFHLGFLSTKGMLNNLIVNDKYGKIEAIFAGHDHRIFKDKLSRNTSIIDSGSYFEFSILTLDKNGKEIQSSYDLFRLNRQEELASQLDEGSLEAGLIKKLKNFIEKIKPSASQKQSRKKTKHCAQSLLQ